MKGMIAAINKALASLDVEVVEGPGKTARGPLRPRALMATVRPSRAPSKSTVFGGSCFVASAAAYVYT